MWDWIVILVLYALGMGFFHWLGGLGAAADALQQWVRAMSDARSRREAASS